MYYFMGKLHAEPFLQPKLFLLYFIETSHLVKNFADTVSILLPLHHF